MDIKPNLFVYILAGVVFFIFWLVVAFPYDALESRVLTEIENQTGGRYKIEMKDMDISLFGSVSFEDLKISEKGAPKGQVLLATPTLEIGFSPLGLMSNEVDLEFYMEGKKSGEIEGDFKQEGPSIELNANFDEFPLAELKFLTQKAKVGIVGNLEGEIADLRFNPIDSSQNQGDVRLQFENVKLEATKIKLDPSDPSSDIEIPAIKLSGDRGSQFIAKLTLDKFNIEDITFKGGDVELDLKGSITMRGKKPGEYRLSLKGQFKLSDKLTKAIPLLGLLEAQKTAEGVYPLTITGRVQKPNIKIGKFRIPI